MIELLYGAEKYSGEDIILVNNTSPVNELNNVDKNILYCPLNIRTGIYLVKNGFKIIWPHRIADFTDFNEIGRRNLERAHRLCSGLDKIAAIGENKSDISVQDLFGSFYYQVKLFIDSMVLTYTLLNRIVDKTGRDKLTFLEQTSVQNKGFSDISPYLKDIILEIPGIKVIKTNTKTGSKMLDGKKKKDNILSSLLSYAGILIKRNKQAKYPGQSGNCFILDYRHDIPYTYKLLDEYFNVNLVQFGNGGMIIKKPGKLLPTFISYGNLKIEGWGAYISNIFKSAEVDKKLSEMFGEKPLFSLILNAVREFFLTAGEEAYSRVKAIERQLMNYKIDNLLVSTTRKNLFESMLISTLKRKGASVIIYQEGGGAGYIDWPFFNYEIEKADYFLGYGESVKTSKYFNGLSERIFSTGSIRLSSLNKVKKKNNGVKRLFFIVDNLKPNLYQHYPNNGGLYSEAYCNQIKILDVLSGFKDRVDITIKVIEGMQELYSFAVAPGITIDTRPLEKILNEADGFIIDAPSTIMLECLTTTKPIGILHTPAQYVYEENELKMLEKRAFIGVNDKQYNNIIKEVVDAMDNGKEFLNNEFCTAFATNEKVEDNLRAAFSKISSQL